jgi:signal transduction histidine kinase
LREVTHPKQVTGDNASGRSRESPPSSLNATFKLRGLRKLAKKGTVEQKERDVNELIRDVSRLTQRAAVGGRVSMRLSLTETLPRLVGDPIQLEQVFLNLVVNAIDAMSQDETGPRDLTIRTWSEKKSSVEIAVADSAPPVSKEILERMFERFYTTKATGLGIGLSTSRSIIEAHGGRLWAEPNPDRGLTLRVRLPAAPDGS